MACKMGCPKCGTMCKIQGDEGKTCSGEYVVIDGDHVRKLKCLACGETSPIWEWDDGT